METGNVWLSAIDLNKNALDIGITVSFQVKGPQGKHNIYLGEGEYKFYINEKNANKWHNNSVSMYVPSFEEELGIKEPIFAIQENRDCYNEKKELCGVQFTLMCNDEIILTEFKDSKTYSKNGWAKEKLGKLLDFKE